MNYTVLSCAPGNRYTGVDLLLCSFDKIFMAYHSLNGIKYLIQCDIFAAHSRPYLMLPVAVLSVVCGDRFTAGFVCLSMSLWCGVERAVRCSIVLLIGMT